MNDMSSRESKASCVACKRPLTRQRDDRVRSLCIICIESRLRKADDPASSHSTLSRTGLTNKVRRTALIVAAVVVAAILLILVSQIGLKPTCEDMYEAGVLNARTVQDCEWISPVNEDRWYDWYDNR